LPPFARTPRTPRTRAHLLACWSRRSDIAAMHDWLRGPLRDAVFGVVLVLLTLRGLNPVQTLTFALFMPVVLLYGIALERSWHARPHAPRTLNASP
jgi:hypothetical protein